MLAWLYDEDRWPSGAAGGLVTTDRKYRERYICFTCNENYAPAADDFELLATFDIQLAADKGLASYRKLKEGEEAIGARWQVWKEVSPDQPWYNGQGALDVMSPEAVKKFIEITHDKYNSQKT